MSKSKEIVKKTDIKQALIPDLEGKPVDQIVNLVTNVYLKNGLSPELELQFIELAINNSPQLIRAAKANPKSLYNSILQAASCGLSLNPQWHEGYFAPYNMKIDGKDVPTVTFSPMYRGKKKLLISNGIVKNILTELVYEGELFDEKIENGVRKIRHDPNSFNRSDPEKIIGGYATIILNNDEIQFVVKGRGYFERCKQSSMAKMNNKISPAWRMWYDEMCLKCLINAADSIISKIGINVETTKLLNDLNINDVDYIDVTNEDQKKIPEAKKTIEDHEFSSLIEQLNQYQISLKSAQQKFKGYEFTDDQKKQIQKAGTITDKKLEEMRAIVLSEKDIRTANNFEFYFDPEKFEQFKKSCVDSATKAGL